MMTAQTTARAINALIERGAAEQPMHVVQLLIAQPRFLAGLDEDTLEAVVGTLLASGHRDAVMHLAMNNALEFDARRHVRALLNANMH